MVVDAGHGVVPSWLTGPTYKNLAGSVLPFPTAAPEQLPKASFHSNMSSVSLLVQQAWPSSNALPAEARRQLVLLLLEDPGCRMLAAHAEVLLRWRMAKLGCINSAVWDNLLQHPQMSLAPQLLSAALMEDHTRNFGSPGPCVHVLGPLQQVCQSPRQHLAAAGPAGPEGWGNSILHLHMEAVHQQCSNHNSAVPAVSNTTPTDTPAAKAGALPQFLFEYESPPQVVGNAGATPAPPPPPAIAVSTASPPSKLTGDIAAAARADVPHAVASCWGAAAAAAGSMGAASNLARSSTSTAAECASSTVPPPGSDADQTGGSCSRRTSSGPAPAVDDQRLSPGTSPTGSMFHPSSGSSNLATSHAHPGAMNTRLSLPPFAQHASLDVAAAHHQGLTTEQLSWLSAAPIITTARSSDVGSLRAAAGGGSGSVTCGPAASGGGGLQMVGSTGMAGGGGSAVVGSPSFDPWGFGQPQSTPPGSATAAGMGSSALLRGNGGGNAAGSLSPFWQRASSHRECGDASSQHPSPASVRSEECDDGCDQAGNMDLESALEAIINYESGAGGHEGGHSVSHAAAAAAQHALQQHVQAAVRAASAVHGNNHQQPTTPHQAMPHRLSVAGSMAAANSLLAGADSLNMPLSPVVGSAPAASLGPGNIPPSFYHQRMAAAINCLSSEGYAGSTGTEPLSPAGSTPMSMAAAAAAAAAAQGAHCGPTGWAAVAAREPMPRTSTAGANTLQHMQAHALMDPSLGASLLAGSAPTGSSMHNSALVAAAAAARTLAAAQHQLPRQPSLSMSGRAMSTSTTAALMAAAKQQVPPLRLHGSFSHDGGIGSMLLGPGGSGGGGRMQDSRMFSRLSPRLRAEIQHLLARVPSLKVEDFDDGVLYQLITKRSEEEAVGALRTLAAAELGGIQHLAAYINHVIKNYHMTLGTASLDGASSVMNPNAAVRASSAPVSSKAILQKLPPRVYQRLEEVVSRCSYMDWKHFDAGVVKVMGQLSELSEADVLEELQLLEATDLSNVEYMPAYLNKRLNNRLWSRRKAQQQQQQAGNA